MTREEAINLLHGIRADNLNLDDAYTKDKYDALGMAIEALSAEPSEDCISRQAVNTLVDELARAISDERCCVSRGRATSSIMQDILDLPPATPKQKMGHCKDCKWWKDSDGLYRRGCHAESQCPINRREVFEGNGYCYMFEPQESED